MEQRECLKFDDVTCFGESSISLVDVTFSLLESENLVIFGPENSGTSLICPLIAGARTDFEGTISYRGRNIKEFDFIEMHNYRTSLGYLQAGYGLINNMSVEENISLPLKYHSELDGAAMAARVNELIAELKLDHCRNLRPVDLLRSETLKTAYARAIALDPALILLEHALETQCLINTQTYLTCVRKRTFCQGCSVIVVTNEPERYADFADTFLMLYNGNIVFHGDRGAFLEQKNPYLKQYMQASLQGPMRIL
ncbi:MAG TPA: ATP-binding cassette domain-containing protein [Spirochaetota bacterium]|nr:ATP-binding cassette domain-containing protein [Spirochaetota bacterium]